MDRFEAAEALSDAVHAASGPPDRRIAIAHSHGGNVAVLAAALEPGLFDAIITLNTPFLTPLPLNRSAVLLHWLLLILSLSLAAATWLPFGYRSIGVSFTVGLAGSSLVVLRLLRSDVERQFRPLVRYSNVKSRGPNPRVLCLMAADDEALGWLEALDVLSNLPRLPSLPLEHRAPPR